MTPSSTCPACLIAYGVREVFSGHLLCSVCDHIWQADLAVTADYAGDYAARTYDTYPETTAHLRAGVLIGMIPSLVDCGAYILDVGYGNGTFLKVMRNAGCRVSGIDVHGKDHGIDEVSFGCERDFSLVTYFDSLEHLPDLSLPLKLRTERVFVSIPQRPDWFRFRPTKWKHFKPGEHLHYFSATSILAYWAQGGYTALRKLDFEDATRGRLKHPELESTTQNIASYLFTRCSR